MIDPNLVKYLGEAEQSRLLMMERMFESEGWKAFMEYIEYQSKQTELALFQAPSWEVNRLEMGKLAILRDMLNLQTTTAAEFEGMALDRQEEDVANVILSEEEYE